MLADPHRRQAHLPKGVFKPTPVYQMLSLAALVNNRKKFRYRTDSKPGPLAPQSHGYSTRPRVLCLWGCSKRQETIVRF